MNKDGKIVGKEGGERKKKREPTAPELK